MSARHAPDGRPRRRRPASPTNAAPPTRVGRSPFLDSCEPLSPIGVSLHESSRLHCVPSGGLLDDKRFGLATDLIVEDRPSSVLTYISAQLFSPIARGNCLPCAIQAHQKPHTVAEISGMTDFGAHDLTRGRTESSDSAASNGGRASRGSRWTSTDRHKNRQGGLHGGVTAALVDAATGYCRVYEPDPKKHSEATSPSP